MWRVFAALLTLIALAPAAAAPPAAKMSGPPTGTVGVPVFLDCRGTAWDTDPPTPHFVLLADRPTGVTVVRQTSDAGDDLSPTLEILFAEAQGGSPPRQGAPAFVVFTPPLPGRYVIGLVATGRMPDTVGADGKPVPGKVAAVGTACVVQVATPGPAPAPPGPDPPPNPVPTPTPVPVPVPVVPVPMSTKLYAIAVFPPDAAGADNFAFAAVRDDPTLPATLAALNVRWLAWPNTDPRVDSLKLRPYLGDPAAGPQVVIYDGAGNVYDGAGAKMDKARATPVRAPLTVQDAVNLFKRMRGQ